MTDVLATRFDQSRARLRAVALRMLGSHGEADDAVQETWLRLMRTEASTIDNVEGWLTTVVARVCLDMLRARKSRREDELAEDAPEPRDAEPSSNPEAETLLADALGPALLVVLETLTPAERVAFKLIYIAAPVRCRFFLWWGFGRRIPFERECPMTCPHCQSAEPLRKRGTFRRKTGPKRTISRYFCRSCGRHSSELTGTVWQYQKRPELNELVYTLLTAGVSQRRTAAVLKTTPVTIARKLVRISRFAERFIQQQVTINAGKVTAAIFDEMETFEHSKCKPLAIAVAVEDKSRFIIAARVASMPAKGRLAAIARRRYGRRANHRGEALRTALAAVKAVSVPDVDIKSDKCPLYPALVREVLPEAVHSTYKGRRGCVVGQGELKAGGWDELFALNHTCAMFRDNLKRLSRRTWCTTKRPDRLQCLLNLYVCAHNDVIARKKSRKLGLSSDKRPQPLQLFALPAGAAM